MVRAYFCTFTVYGFWLPNDPRGSGSAYVGSKDLLPYGLATKVHARRSVARKRCDPVIRREAKSALKYPPVQLTGEQALWVANGFREILRNPISESKAWIYSFQGGRQDPVSGLIHFGRRDYSTSLGRWTEADPTLYGDGPNVYQMEQSGPTDGTDPTGLYDAAGHFYTVYMVAIAEGMTAAQAYELAYYAQLPDQISDFDAINAFNKLAALAAADANDPWPDAARAADINAQMQWYRDVQKILHSLHGGPQAPRRACLQKLLKDPSLKPWERGFILHALGDAYAHTQPNGQAYPPVIGHGLSGHEPDIIGNNVPLYQLYIHDLYLALGGNPQAEAANLPLVMLKNFANGFAGNSNAAYQITMMRKFASGGTFGYANPYAPENGGTDPAMRTPTHAEVQSLIDKIKKACGCK